MLNADSVPTGYQALNQATRAVNPAVGCYRPQPPLPFITIIIYKADESHRGWKAELTDALVKVVQPMVYSAHTTYLTTATFTSVSDSTNQTQSEVK